MARDSRSRSALPWLLVCTLLACAHPSAKAPAPEPLAESGRVLFELHCAFCHGPGGDGRDAATTGPRSAALDLTRIAERNGGAFPADRVARAIDGRLPIDVHLAEMPAWGDELSFEVPDPELREEVTRGRISALVAHLRTLQVTGETR